MYTGTYRHKATGKIEEGDEGNPFGHCIVHCRFLGEIRRLFCEGVGFPREDFHALVRFCDGVLVLGIQGVCILQLLHQPC